MYVGYNNYTILIKRCYKEKSPAHHRKGFINQNQRTTNILDFFNVF
jgi:hypothetical protein